MPVDMVIVRLLLSLLDLENRLAPEPTAWFQPSMNGFLGAGWLAVPLPVYGQLGFCQLGVLVAELGTNQGVRDMPL